MVIKLKPDTRKSSYFFLISILYLSYSHLVDSAEPPLDAGGNGGSKSTPKIKHGLEAINDPEVGSALDPHPNPNEENYDGMIYVGMLDIEGHRVGFDVDNGKFC